MTNTPYTIKDFDLLMEVDKQGVLRWKSSYRVVPIDTANQITALRVEFDLEGTQKARRTQTRLEKLGSKNRLGIWMALTGSLLNSVNK